LIGEIVTDEEREQAIQILHDVNGKAWGEARLIVIAQALAAERTRAQKETAEWKDKAATYLAETLDANEALTRAKTIIAELAEELELRVKNDYGWPNIHPANVRRFDRDMTEVNDARRFIEGQKDERG
jgi:hypothetical protein